MWSLGGHGVPAYRYLKAGETFKNQDIECGVGAATECRHIGI